MGIRSAKLLIAFLLIPSLVYGAAIQGKEEGSVVGYCKSIDFVGGSQTLTSSGLDCTLTSTAGDVGGDVGGVGDCTGGDCLDGTSDGGTWLKFYDAQGAGQLITGDLTGARVWTFPDETGTVVIGEINEEDINWPDFINGLLSSAGVNWLDVEQLKSVKSSGINWQGLGDIPSADMNWLDTQDLDTDGSVKWGNLAEGELTDSTIVSADIKDGTIAAADLAAATITPEICFIIDGGGSAVTTGAKTWVRASTTFTIGGVQTTADQSGSCVIDIWKDSYANFPPTDADTITAAAPPTLSTAQKAEDTTLTGWTKTITAGDYLRVNVDSCSTVTFVEVCIYE